MHNFHSNCLVSIELGQWAVSNSYEKLDHSNQISSSRLLFHEMCAEFAEWVMMTFWNNDEKLKTNNQFLHLVMKWRGTSMSYRLITAYLLLRVNLDKIMHARWDFDESSARTRRVSALDKHQNWSASALFCLNSRAQSKYTVVNLIHTQHKQNFFVFFMW